MTDPSTRHASMQEHRILKALREQGGSCRTAELAVLLGVSEETVRRNIKRLVRDGLAVKVHGGVFLSNVNEEPAFNQRLGENREAKLRMAKCVADTIPDGASLFLDNASTTTFVAEALRVRRNLFVVTNSITAAGRLSAHNHNRIFFAGGELRESDGGSYSAEAMDFVRGFNPDFAILAAAAINAENGFMLTDLAEAAFARAYIRHARTSIVVADQTKIGLNGPIVIEDPVRIAMLVTDAPVPGDLAAAAAGWNIEVVVAPPDGACRKEEIADV